MRASATIWSLLGGALTLGCTPTGEQPAPTAAASPAPASQDPSTTAKAPPKALAEAHEAGQASVAEPAPGPLEIAWGKRLRAPSSFKPPAEPGMSDHPVQAGFAADQEEFFFWVTGGGRDCDQYRFFRPPSERHHEELTRGSECDAPTPKATLQRRLDEGDFAIRDGDWAYGAQVVLVAQETYGAKDDTDLARGVVRFGARLRETEDTEHVPTVGWVERVESCVDYEGVQCAPDVHVDFIAPAPSGDHVTAVLHSFAGEFMDGYPVVTMSATALAGAAYRAEGMTALTAKRWRRAEALFARAANIDPDDWRAPYNLARARVGASDLEGARVALDEAQRRGGDAVQQKASRDPDLTALREP